MYLYTYDGTFEGLLTVVFEAYERKAWPVSIARAYLVQPDMFGESITVVTDDQKASRVWSGLQKKLSVEAQQALYYAFLWEQKGYEMLVFDYIKLVFDSPVSIEGNYAAPCVLQLQQVHKQVHREKHRMEAFVRFQKTSDGLYFATIAPDFNVLPIVINHFEKRYADQRWVIYDLHRKYGAYYDLASTLLIDLEETGSKALQAVLLGNVLDEEEDKYKQLWQVYFDHVNIPERKNPKLHQRHMPKRYWKYLSEKQPKIDLKSERLM
ncbi:TIGR03915 family putative DNA repair protein [Pontibacter silvestris]|uniref:TIGR03915 family putative DNA repair protein n=1 Tax=Pontibacter silvestris TaxID=2305183 RepID=A0ABW4WY32_9BACT|nr:TIGR03915 family putative DNA repair protein [Pontibacter silvestris]MCC9136713.1 TIGR03915 family putative DNA repair protein [Pontibacter silvestris]